MSAAAGPDIIEDGLVLCLDAGNRDSYPGSGTVWRDLAGSNNGTLVNGPTFNNANGGSIVFDGSNDFINMGSTPFLQEFTVNIWFRIFVNKNFNAVFNIGGDGSENIEVLFFSTGLMHTPINFSDGRQSTDFANYISATNTWYHLSYSYKSNEGRRVYRNGRLFGLDNVIGKIILQPSNFFYLGSDPGPGRHLNGEIASTILYNRALTPAEILQNYNATKSRFLL
jgi:Concanavalin A-like lectin/glucanases superfamily